MDITIFFMQSEPQTYAKSFAKKRSVVKHKTGLHLISKKTTGTNTIIVQDHIFTYITT
jgi:hypothetical protein